MPVLTSFRFAILASGAALASCGATPPPSLPAPTSPPINGTPVPTPAPAPAPSPTPAPTTQPIQYTPTANARFNRWRDDFSGRAIARGFQRSTVYSVLEGLEPQNTFLRAAAAPSDQAEFAKPIWQYVNDTVSSSRKRNGKEKFAENKSLLQDLENEYGVPGRVLVAIWGMETSYGGYIGDFDAPEALASMAVEGRRKRFAEGELYAIMRILERGDAKRDELVAGWAGAMGQTQFMPSTYYEYAVDWTGDGSKDVWRARADALASAGNYLKASGWRKGEPSILEVKLPGNFDYALADGEDRRIETWLNAGLTPIEGGALDSGGAGYAELWLPAGAFGPAYLLFENFNVIKKYNRADSYALSVSLLADSVRGVEGPKTAWPTDLKLLTVGQVKELQAALNELGYDAGPVDGIAGRGTRGALQKFQKARGIPADGFPTVDMLNKVLAAV